MNRTDLYNAFNDVDTKLLDRSETGESFARNGRKRNGGRKSGWNVLSPILVAVALIATLTVIAVIVTKNRNNNDANTGDPLANQSTESPSEIPDGTTAAPDGTTAAPENTNEPLPTSEPSPTAEPINFDTVISYFVSFRKSSGAVDYMLFFKNSDGSGRVEQYRLESTGGEGRLASYETLVNGTKFGEAPVSVNVMRTVENLIKGNTTTMAFDAHGTELPLDRVSFATEGNEFSIMISSGVYVDSGDPRERNLLLSYHDSWTSLTDKYMPEASIAMLMGFVGVSDVPGADTCYSPGRGADRTVETLSLTHEEGTEAFILEQQGETQYNRFILTLSADKYGFDLYRCITTPDKYANGGSIQAERLISVRDNYGLLPLIQYLVAGKKSEFKSDPQVATVVKGTMPKTYRRIMMLAMLYDVDGYIGGQFDAAELFCSIQDLAYRALSSKYPEFADLSSDRLNVFANRTSYNKGWLVRFMITLGGKNLDWYYEYSFDGGRGKYTAEYHNGTDFPDRYPELCFPEGLLRYEIPAEEMARYEEMLLQQIKDQIVPGKLMEPNDLEEMAKGYWEVIDGWLCLRTEVIASTVDPESFEYGCQGHAHLFGSVQVVDLSQF